MFNDSNFLQDFFLQIANQNQQQHFVFIVAKPFSTTQKNITTIVVKQPVSNMLALRFFYDIKLPIILKKYKPNILVQLNGFCSLSTSIPQLLLLLNTTQPISKKRITKATHIITNALATKNNIAESYQIDTNKIDVVYGAAQPLFKPLNADEILQTKDGFADGREYFLFVSDKDSSNNIINVLKAFSLFKKWQRSNMKLVVVGGLDENIAIKIATYKYKDDVVLLGNVAATILPKIMASAYCVLYPTLTENFAIPILEAMQSGVPIIASNLSGIKEVGGNAIFYINPNSSDEMAEQMQLIYKDEILRSKLIKDGLLQVTKFNHINTAILIDKVIAKFSHPNVSD